MCFDDDIEDLEATCPKCGQNPIRRRDCTNFCEDGYFDESEDDPINFMPGESERKCDECMGTGAVVWCPKCGADLTLDKIKWDEEY